MRFFVFLLSLISIFTLMYSHNNSVAYTASLFQAISTPTPTPPTMLIELNLQDNALPQTKILAPNPNLSIIPATLSYTPKQRSQLSKAKQNPKTQNSNSKLKLKTNLVDNWHFEMAELFEGNLPNSYCATFDNSTDGFDRTWYADDYKQFDLNKAAWPAAGGNDALDPATNNYPPNLESWLECGPFSLENVTKIMVRYGRWLEITDPDDSLFMGISINGGNYTGLRTYGTQDWTQLEVLFNLTPTQRQNTTTTVSLLWQFISDGDTDQAQGPWLDSVELWYYTPSTQTCGSTDPGNKGLVLPAYDPAIAGQFPIIRNGDSLALDAAIATDAQWVRWVFEQKNGAIDLRDYDKMVDSLCANNINVLGIINHQSLVDQGFNNATYEITYTHKFTTTAALLVEHYKDRITYWEVWNEPDYDPSGELNLELPPYLKEDIYARLLNNSYNTIKAVNPEAKVLFGGLSSIDGGLVYLDSVYEVWNQQMGGVSPYDILALHPYFDLNTNNSLDPNVYLYENGNIRLNKFTELMAGNEDSYKKIWITEIGWNSAPQNHPDLDCWADKVVTNQEQATYLSSSFDILFNEVTLWQTDTLAIDKVFWYQFMDVGIENELVCPDLITTTTRGFVSTGYIPPGYVTNTTPTQAPVPWEFGLYQGDKQGKKPAQCAFKMYPSICKQVYVPLVFDKGNTTQ